MAAFSFPFLPPDRWLKAFSSLPWHGMLAVGVIVPFIQLGNVSSSSSLLSDFYHVSHWILPNTFSFANSGEHFLFHSVNNLCSVVPHFPMGSPLPY